MFARDPIQPTFDEAATRNGRAMLAPTGLGATECIAVGEGLAPPRWWDQHPFEYTQKTRAGFGRGKPLPYGLQLNQRSVFSVGGRTQFTPLRGACYFTEAPRRGKFGRVCTFLWVHTPPFFRFYASGWFWGNYFATARMMKVTACARVQSLPGLKSSSVMPVVTPASTAHATALA